MHFQNCSLICCFQNSWSIADMEFVKNFTPSHFQENFFTPSISPNSNSFSKKKHKKMMKMEKFTLLAKILHCRRHWRHGQIPPLEPVCWIAQFLYHFCTSNTDLKILRIQSLWAFKILWWFDWLRNLFKYLVRFAWRAICELFQTSTQLRHYPPHTEPSCMIGRSWEEIITILGFISKTEKMLSHNLSCSCMKIFRRRFFSPNFPR